MPYDLIDLRLFVAIAELNNLTRGAERVHLAPSSASHRIRLLEASIGTPLLLREARGVKLTRAGESLLRHAQQVFAQLEQMHADLSPYAKGVRSHVSLWANTHATHTFLPDSFSAFLRCYPQVSITLEEHTSPEVVMAIVRGEVEVGVVAESVEGVLSATQHEIAAAVWSAGEAERSFAVRASTPASLSFHPGHRLRSLIEDFVQRFGVKHLDRPGFQLIDACAGQSGADSLRNTTTPNPARPGCAV